MNVDLIFKLWPKLAEFIFGPVCPLCQWAMGISHWDKYECPNCNHIRRK